MKVRSPLANWFRSKTITGTSATGPRPRVLLRVEALEDRSVPSTYSSISANFNPTAIPAGDSLWFSSVFKVAGLPPGTSSLTLHVTGQAITFTAAGTAYSVPVPDATINLSSSTNVATTQFNTGSGSWVTNVPLPLPGGNVFLSGAEMPVNVSLPGGIQNVTWSGDFWSDGGNPNVTWQWGAAVYKPGFGDVSLLNVKPLDAGGAVTVYTNNDHAGTPEAYKSLVTAGATGGGGTNYTGGLSPGKNVTAGPGQGLLYPFPSSNPLTSIAFNESDVLAGAKLDTANGFFDVWYTDEHALSLGVRQVNVTTSAGTATTNYPVAPLTTDPGSAAYPAIGSTATGGDQAGADTSGRPISPSLFITDTTSNPSSLSGDWQYGGAAYAPSNVFGAWKGVVRTVNHTTATPTVTVTCDADPAKNGANLGAGADTPPPGTSIGGEGYSAEVRWSLTDLTNQGILQAGHTYRFYVMVHDGDQNKSGGDAGQAAFNYYYPGPANVPATLAGFVYDGTNNVALVGVQLTLTELVNGQNVFIASTTTAADGSYSFTNLQPGVYTITQTPPPPPAGLLSETSTAQVGTVNGGIDGSTPSGDVISGINLAFGNNGVNYNFTDFFAGS
jgi:hypothetical protein